MVTRVFARRIPAAVGSVAAGVLGSFDSIGVVVVAAAGNSDHSFVGYPAAHPDVIAVGAVDTRGVRAEYSNYGGALDLVAPGGDVSRDDDGDGYEDGILQWTFAPDWGFHYFDGTSMATPHVSAVVALMKQWDPQMDPSRLRQVLRSSAVDLGDPGWDAETGSGLLSAANALRMIRWSDLEETHWARDSIDAIYAADVTVGCGPADTTPLMYCPDRAVSRAEMAAFLVRALGEEGNLLPYAGTFPDVLEGVWYTPYVELLADLGVTSGYPDGTYRPLDSVNRAEMAAFLSRAWSLDPG